MKKIKCISRSCEYIITFILVALPITYVMFWLQAPQAIHYGEPGALWHLSMSYIPPHIVIATPLSWQSKSIGALIGLLPFSLEFLCFYFLRQLFNRFKQGITFHRDTVSALKNSATCLFLGQLISPFYQALQTANLTWHNPHGQRVIAISFSQYDLTLLVIALMISIVAWVFSEGERLAENDRLTI